MQVSQRLRNSIVGHMWEIYNNAFERSGSEISVFTCGQHFPGRNRTEEIMVPYVVEFGQALPAKIRGFFRQHAEEELVTKLTSASCLRCAFQAGNTTKVGEPGGSRPREVDHPMTSAFQPNFTITNRMTQAITRFERDFVSWSRRN